MAVEGDCVPDELEAVGVPFAGHAFAAEEIASTLGPVDFEAAVWSGEGGTEVPAYVVQDCGNGVRFKVTGGEFWAF